MADGDYERGRSHEIGAIAAKLKRLRNGQDARSPSILNGQDARCPSAGATVRPPVFVLNGWAASPHAWDLCKFMCAPTGTGILPAAKMAAFPVNSVLTGNAAFQAAQTETTGVLPVAGTALPRLFSYVEQMDGEPEKAIENVQRCILVGWSMGGSSALRLAARWPEKIAGLVLIAATPRMMEEKETGWKGMSPRRLEALRYGLVMTHGVGMFGVPEGKPNPYLLDEPANLERGLNYLLETDVRADIERVFGGGHGATRPTLVGRPALWPPPVYIFQSEHDGIVRAANATYLQKVFPQASVTMVPGTEHALPIFIPELIDEAVDTCIRLAAAGQDIA